MFEKIKAIALSFPETSEAPHFEKTSFRVKQKIFVTCNLPKNRICVKLSATQQSIFSAFDPQMIYPVPNKWGKQGWTLVELQNLSLELLEAVLLEAYCEVAPPKLAKALQEKYLNE